MGMGKQLENKNAHLELCGRLGEFDVTSPRDGRAPLRVRRACLGAGERGGLLRLLLLRGATRELGDVFSFNRLLLFSVNKTRRQSHCPYES